MASYVFAFVVLVLASTQAFASDPSQLQDFCVADNAAKARRHEQRSGIQGHPRQRQQPPRLNTLGISLVRIDFARHGLNPPHTHPRATEVLTLLQGQLHVGFVTSNPPKLFTKILNKGDVFVFPQGLIHFQLNIGHENAVAIAGLSSQNPGVITIANAVFGSNPAINDDVLEKAFQIDKKIVDYLKSQFWTDNN
ncbi:unnamed protein product [Spirodela intermedia]|uniref:Germin-like protein n=1 Tax=Spirodela intermedia TaxID=51605 RepID=A0A7I8IFP6_SPIIN|nr:unnamed protein product [Spirodela intermedia]CAA6656626.1 unnamed protein product [Spirodela intermedia]CAA6674431.1 unnamed protein product [Spirodela intermedia]